MTTARGRFIQLRSLANVAWSLKCAIWSRFHSVVFASGTPSQKPFVGELFFGHALEMSGNDGTTTEKNDASGGGSRGGFPPKVGLTVSRDRDAWKTIRGFGYQIGLTVERWLQLTDGETLELENGEDIDRITPSLIKDQEVSARVLEQVKHLDANVTLRSGPCLEALANAVDHLEQNPGKELYFQFTTTAGVGLEQKSP